MKCYLGKAYTCLALGLLSCDTKIQYATAHCENDPDFTYNNNDKKTCQWIRFKPNRRKNLCKFVTVHKHCPQTCGVCCEDDANFLFDIKAGVKKKLCVAKDQERKSRYMVWCVQKRKQHQTRLSWIVWILSRSYSIWNWAAIGNTYRIPLWFTSTECRSLFWSKY